MSDAQETLDRLNAALDAEQEELTDAERTAIAALSEERERVETVTIGSVDVDVKAYVDGRVENHLLGLIEELEDPEHDIKDSKEDMIALLAWFAADPASPFASIKVWRVYAKQYGMSGLVSAFEKITAPAIEVMEDVKASKEFRNE